MGNSQLIFVLGDSHVRSFAYSQHTIPCFLGPGKTLLINNASDLTRTIEKFSTFLSGLSPNSQTLVITGEASIRDFLSQPKSRLEIKYYLQTLVEYFQVIKDALRRVNQNTTIIPPIPRSNDVYAAAWFELVSMLKEANFENSDVFDQITQKGILNGEYVGDFVHANSRLADVVLDRLFYKGAESKNEYGWHYQSVFPCVTIWGGVPISVLSYTGEKTRDWGELLKKTTSANAVIDILNSIITRFGNSKPIFVREKGEQYFSQRINQESFSLNDQISELDLQRSKALAEISDSRAPYGRCMADVSEYGLFIDVESSRTDIGDVTVDFLHERGRKTYRKRLVVDVSQVELFLISSRMTYLKAFYVGLSFTLKCLILSIGKRIRNVT